MLRVIRSEFTKVQAVFFDLRVARFLTHVFGVVANLGAVAQVGSTVLGRFATDRVEKESVELVFLNGGLGFAIGVVVGGSPLAGYMAGGKTGAVIGHVAREVRFIVGPALGRKKFGLAHSLKKYKSSNRLKAAIQICILFKFISFKIGFYDLDISKIYININLYKINLIYMK